MYFTDKFEGQLEGHDFADFDIDFSRYISGVSTLGNCFIVGDAFLRILEFGKMSKIQQFGNAFETMKTLGMN